MTATAVLAALLCLAQTGSATTTPAADVGVQRSRRTPITVAAVRDAAFDTGSAVVAAGADAGVSFDAASDAAAIEPPAPAVGTERPKRRRAKTPADAAVMDASDAGIDAGFDAGLARAPVELAPVTPTPPVKEPTVPGWLLEVLDRARTPAPPPVTVAPDQGPPILVERPDPWSALAWILGLLLVVFGGLRLAAFFVRRAARREAGWALALSRAWMFAEAIVWLVVAVWLVNRFYFAQSGLTASLLSGLFLLAVALGFGPLRDVLAGLVLSMERPFQVGDQVQISEQSGRVRAFHLRVLELVGPGQEVLRIPYRQVAESTSARSSVPRRAHPVRRTFGLPEGIDPAEALRTARELALASPWAVLGLRPEVELERGGDGEQLRVVAFAFASEAESWLAADLEAGWREASRRWAQG